MSKNIENLRAPMFQMQSDGPRKQAAQQKWPEEQKLRIKGLGWGVN